MVRRTTPEQRQRLLTEYRRSGLTQKVFAQSKGISLSALKSWLYPPREQSRHDKARFVEVTSNSNERLEVRVGPVEIHVPVSFDDERVATLVSALVVKAR